MRRILVQAQLSRQAEFHRANLDSYRAAREAYLKKVEGAVEFVKDKGLTGAARAAADEVLARVGEAKSGMLAAPGFVLNKVWGGGQGGNLRQIHHAGEQSICSGCLQDGMQPSPEPCSCIFPAQVHEAVDRLLAFSPVHSALEAAKPTFNAVSWDTEADRRQGMHDFRLLVASSAARSHDPVMVPRALRSPEPTPHLHRPEASTCGCMTRWWRPSSTSRLVAAI
jgi:hypothetical protein